MNKNIIYLCTYINTEISNKIKLPYSKAGLKKKDTIINALSQKNAVRVISTCIYMRFKFGLFKAFKIKSSDILIEFPSFITIPFINIIYNILSTIIYINKIDKQKKIDCIIVYNYTIDVLFPALLFYIKNKTPIICQLEDGWALENKILGNVLNKICYQILKKIPSGIIANSYNLVKKFDNDNYVIIRGSIPEINDDIAIPSNDKIIILFSSTLDNVRGIELLMDYFHNINDQNIISKTKIIITGKGDNYIINRLNKSMEIYRSKGGDVEYKGYIEDDELANILKTSDLLLNLQNPNLIFSKYCFPSKIIDYMSYGKEIITTKVSDLLTHFNMNFIFIDYGAKSLESKIFDIINGKRPTRRDDFIRYVRENININTYTEKVESILTKINYEN